jgi:hypothetical protein
MTTLRFHMRGVKLLFLALVLLASLATSGVAVAQLSARYDMACRGTFANAGGTRLYTSQNFALTSSLGQPGVGRSTSANRGLRAGYIQPAARAAAQVSAEGIEQDDHLLFLPKIGAAIQVLRLCTW